MTLFDCSPVSDGAAMVLLVSEDLAKAFSDSPLYLIGSGQASDGALPERETLSGIPAAEKAGKQAYEMAGLTPDDIDLAEVHDCFTIAEIMASEDLGFFPRGEGWKAAMEGKTARDGEHPINTSGGLKARGTRWVLPVWLRWLRSGNSFTGLRVSDSCLITPQSA